MGRCVGLFDVHAHLTHPRFADDIDAVIARATAAGLTTIISNGLNVTDNQRVLELAARHPAVQPALGLYPVDAVLEKMLAAGVDYPRDDADLRDWQESVQWVADHAHEAFAIGEVGLDHHWVPEPFWQEQEEVFRALVRVAIKADRPLIIHTRKAEARAFEILQEMGATRVNWHCYSSRLKLGKRIADAGYYLSIPANARRHETFSGLLRGADRRQLLLETDCPYLAPEAGVRNEPAFVTTTCEYAAELWGTSVAEAQAQFEENFHRLFGIAP